MLIYVIRRVFYSVPVLIVSTFLIFTFVATTTDPLEAVKMQPNVNHAAIALVEKQNHLKDPIVVRYGYWVRDAFTNGFGKSILGERKILPDMVNRLKVTLQLVIAGWLLALLLAIGLGVYSAIRQYSLFDYTFTAVSFVGIAIPVFWLGLILQIIFVNVYNKWGVRIFYTSGLDNVAPGHGLHFVVQRAQHLVLPVITLSAVFIAGYARFMRASMLEVLNADYIRTARAKGMIESRVIMRHAFRNALIPLMTLAAIDFGGLFGGTAVTEIVYGLPGMGRYLYDAVQYGETYEIMAWLTFTAILTILFNLIADIILGVIDPRIRLD